MNICIFENYETLFTRVERYVFIPKITPEELYCQTELLQNHMITKIWCNNEELTDVDKYKYSIFEFILHFIDFSYLIEYLTKLPKECIAIFGDNSDIIHLIILEIENRDELNEDILIKLIEHANKEWKIPFTFDALVETINFRLYKITDIMLHDNPKLINEKNEDGEGLFEIFNQKYYSDEIKEKIKEYIDKYHQVTH